MIIVQITIIFILLAVIVMVSGHLSQILIKNSTPFFSSGKKIIKKAIENIEIEPEMTIYELGCGKAEFLKQIKREHPRKNLKLVGVENFIFPLLLLKIQNKIKGYNIEIKNKDLFQSDFSDADIIYCFLNVHAMKELKPKLFFQCRPGTKVVSYQFSIPGVEPNKVIKYPSRHRIFIYQI